MSSGEKRTEELLDKLILDIKALVLLHGTDVELKARLEKKVARSNDQSVRRFVETLQTGRRPDTRRLIAVALGEFILASLLTLAGVIVLIPTMVGISTPDGLVQYFAQRFYGGIASSPLAPYVSFVEFAIGALLMLSALYTLRQAASDLKEAGLRVRHGET